MIGPLYKTVLRRPKPVGFREQVLEFAVGPCALSVTKINQIISLYVVFLWLVLLFKALPHLSLGASINWVYVLMIGTAFSACTGFVTLGKRGMGPMFTPPPAKDTDYAAGPARQSSRPSGQEVACHRVAKSMTTVEWR